MAEDRTKPPSPEPASIRRPERRGVMLGIGGIVVLIALGLFGVAPPILAIAALVFVAILVKIGIKTGRRRVERAEPDRSEASEARVGSQYRERLS